MRRRKQPKRPDVYRVRIVKVWETDQPALSEQEAIDQALDYFSETGYDEGDTHHVAAQFLRVATPDETAAYYADAAEEQAGDTGDM